MNMGVDMVSFAEMLEAYGAQNDTKSLFSEMLANAPAGGMQAPLDRDKALMSMKAGDDWHNNMVRLVAALCPVSIPSWPLIIKQGFSHPAAAAPAHSVRLDTFPAGCRYRI